MIKLTEKQVETLTHIIALMGDGELHTEERDVEFGYVWFNDGKRDWCIRDDGVLAGWNDAA